MEKFVLALESSCDETAASIVRAEYSDTGTIASFSILSHVVESQIEVHRPFGGVVPEVAARDHLSKIDYVVRKAFLESQTTIEDMSHIAVTMGPGLIGALMVGVLYARGLSLSSGIPLVGVNHVDAHLAPALLFSEFSQKEKIPFDEIAYPCLSLTVSGGHCLLSRLESFQKRDILGKTRDDACGEAFDKVAKLLGLPYPGGPQIQELACFGQSSSFSFPSTLGDKSDLFNFSYSGLKTSVLFAVRKELGILSQKGKVSGASLDVKTKQEIAYSFQEAAIFQLIDRMKNAIKQYKGEFRSVAVAGGVAANSRFRELLNTECSLSVRFAPLSLCSDNATMIALHSFFSSFDAFRFHPFSRYDVGVQYGN